MELIRVTTISCLPILFIWLLMAVIYFLGGNPEFNPYNWDNGSRNILALFTTFCLFPFINYVLSKVFRD